MKYKKILLTFGILVALASLAYLLYQGDVKQHGRLYPNKQALCQEFAQSYLRTVQKTDKATGQRWGMAIDIETDLYEMCLLDLNPQAIRGYKPTAPGKY